MGVEQVVGGDVQSYLLARQFPEPPLRGEGVVLLGEPPVVDIAPPRGSHCPSPHCVAPTT